MNLKDKKKKEKYRNIINVKPKKNKIFPVYFYIYFSIYETL